MARTTSGNPSETAFSQWLKQIFDHRVTDRPWWSQGGATTTWNPLGRPSLTLEYLRRMCDEAGTWSRAYTPEQIAQGLWFLFDPSCSESLRPLVDENVDRAARVRCIAAMKRLYSELFARRCREELRHTAANRRTADLNDTCYMLWDIALLHPRPNVPAERPIDEACLDVMRASLRIPHVACRESALHGLGHWQGAYPERVGEIIGEFLSGSRPLPPALSAYAESVRGRGVAPSRDDHPVAAQGVRR